MNGDQKGYDMYIKNYDTICAPATIPGTGAISIIRISGPEALKIADNVIHCRNGRISDSKGYTIRFGTVQDNSGKMLDEVLASIFRAPHSYTGEDSVEISCHASAYIVSELMGLLYSAGARAAEPGEFTQRAYLNGKMDLAQDSSQADERRLFVRAQGHEKRTSGDCISYGTRA